MHQLQIKDYEQWLDELKMPVKSVRISVARSVSRGQNALYWEIREWILATQSELGWGEAVVDRISTDLKTAFPGVTGFSSRNLRDMKRLVSTYSDEAKWRQVVAKFDNGVETSVLSAAPRLFCVIAHCSGARSRVRSSKAARYKGW